MPKRVRQETTSRTGKRAMQVATILSLGFSATALAADETAAAGDQTGGVQEVVVTATRRAESVVEVPYNIQAVSAEQLEKTGARVMSDFIRTIPGVSFIDQGPSLGMDVVLRGLRTTAASGNQRTTSIYIDDVEIPADFDPRILDLSRVEVLRGPQGTLYGSGAIGGTIRYITEKPSSKDWQGMVMGEGGQTRHGGNNTAASGMLNVPLVDDRLALRANVGYFDNSGFLDNVRLQKKDVNTDRTFSGRAGLLATPIEGLEINLAYFFQNTDFGSDNTIDEDVGKFSNTNYFVGGSRFDHDITSLTASYDFGFASLTSSTSYRRNDAFSVRDITNDVRDVIYASFLPPDLIPDITSNSTRNTHEHFTTQELRLVSNSQGPLSWIAGAYWEKSRSRFVAQEQVPIPFPGQAEFEDLIGSPITDTKDYFFGAVSDFKQEALFGELGYQLTPHLNASVGARYFKYDSSADFFAIDQYFGGRNPDGTARTEPLPDELSVGSAEASDTIFRFNSSYKTGETGLAYLTIAEGYRPGGYNLVGKNTGIAADQFQYDPDSVVNYEIGFKDYVLDHRLYVSTALYYIDWKDIQTTVITPSGFYLVGNAGKAHSTGAELELSARDIIVPGLTLSAGYSYTSTKLDETVDGLGFDGDRAPYVPKHTGSLIADYAFPISGTLRGGLNFLTSYTGSAATDFGADRPNLGGGVAPNDQFLPLDAYWLTNVSARVTNGAWTARLALDNVFDKYGDISRSYRAASSPFRTPYVYRTVNRPRTVALSVTWRF